MSAIEQQKIVPGSPSIASEEWLLRMEDWNATTASFPHERCIHELIEAQAARVPQRPAVRCGDQTLSYAQLNAQANRVAHYLRAQGVGPDVCVGLFAERSLAMMVGMLGILKAGAAYVPLDVDYPEQRLLYMIQNSGFDLLLTHQAVDRQAQTLLGSCASLQMLSLDAPDIQRMLAAFPDSDPARLPAQSPANLAYVMYTSGSTGLPKGVMIEHRSVVNRMNWINGLFGTDETDVFLHKAPLSFDVSVSELIWPLSIGACIVMADPGSSRDIGLLTALIQQTGVTVLEFVPSMLMMTVREGDWAACTSVRAINCGGEALSPEIIRQHYAIHGATLYNTYGPTEATIDVTCWVCPRDRTLARVSIGKSAQNVRLYILDDQGRRVPPGVAGELYIGGIGVARGYLNRDDLTAERFLPDPYADEPGGRMYRTGDLAQFWEDGNVEYLGRIDSQVKFNGLRIELGEIETGLLGHPIVAAAAVLAREDIPGEQQLVGYVVLTRSTGATGMVVPTAMLRSHLQRTLPSYMVPSLFVVLRELPLSPSGKVDARALPVPQPTLRRLALMRQAGLAR